MPEECIIEFEHTEHRGPGDNRRWRMGLSQGDHKWLVETLGMRAKRPDTWANGVGAWRYLGCHTITSMGTPRYLVKMLFRSKSHAILFKLSRLGKI